MNTHEYESLIIESSNNAIIAIDWTAKIITYNKKAEDIFGWTKEEMLGTRNLLNIIPPKYKNLHTNAHRLYLDTGKSCGVINGTHELEGINKDGDIFPIQISFGSDWKPKAAIVIANIVDITEKKEIENQLDILNKNLEQKVKEALHDLDNERLEHEKNVVENTKFSTIGQMAAGITHEINTPLTYIKGTVEMSRYDLKDMPDNDFKQRLLDDNKQVMDGINRMSIIVESMREVSQVTPTVREEYNIYATLITVLRMIYNRSKQISKIYINNELFDLETSNKDQYQFMALIHKQRIEQVWTIILNNALDELVKITHYKDRRIDINIYKEDNSIKVEVCDNAGGIPEYIEDKIFEPFVSSKESSGIGIGLNVAKKIVDEHHATIDAINKDNGACFTIELPLDS